MFRKRTVLVVGAGASCEFQFPNGAKLLQDVAEDLAFHFQYATEQISGHRGLWQALNDHQQRYDPRTSMQQYFNAAVRLSESAKIARSIDNAIDQNDGDPLIPIVGKMAIARRLMQAEVESSLYDPRSALRADVAKLTEKTWLYHFGQMLTTDRRASSAEDVFQNLTIITFNYDRVIEYALPTILTTAYGLEETKAAELAATCEIYHPYGSLGTIPIGPHVRADEHTFGAPGDLMTAARRLKTFGESIEMDDKLSAMRRRVSEAEQLIFLGFAFHRPNLWLIAPDNAPSPNVYGTVYKEPLAAVRSFYEETSGIFNARSAPDLQNLTAADFMQQYYTPLTN